MAESDILNSQEAAAFLRTSLRTIREFAATGKLPAKKIGREWRFSRAALEKWVASSRNENEMDEFAKKAYNASTEGVDNE